MGCEIVLEELASFFLTKFWVGFIFIFSFFRGLFLFYFFLFNMDFMVRNSVSLLEEKKKKKEKGLILISMKFFMTRFPFELIDANSEPPRIVTVGV